jgi:lipopolysaccharide export system permease protein
MIKLLDQQMVRGYFKAYGVCLLSMLSLYIVVDLFTNLDDFASRNKVFSAMLRHIGTYYSIKIFQIFDRLCEVIVLLAAVFTVALMQRNNEQIPYLSAGVSTHRLVLPVLCCACVTLTLALANQELILPQFADQLLYEKDDPIGDKELSVQRGAYEPSGVHMEGGRATRKGMMVRDLHITIPPAVGGNLLHIIVKEAHFRPTGPRGGTWELIGTKPAELEPIAGVLEVQDVGRYLLHTREVNFDMLTRDQKWFLYASTWRLFQELQNPDAGRATPMAVLFHTRLTRFVLGLLLVIMGVSLVLNDQNRNLVISASSCLGLCASFYVVTYICRLIGEYELVSPALAAYLPILLFGPFAWLMYDAIQT